MDFVLDKQILNLCSKYQVLRLFQLLNYHFEWCETGAFNVWSGCGDIQQDIGSKFRMLKSNFVWEVNETFLFTPMHHEMVILY
jgi:hypothetical protein